MPCLFVMVAGFLPRLGSILLWIARPGLFSAAFGGSWFLPVLGIIFLPFTTLMYVILWSPVGLSVWDWIWLLLAVMIDVAHYGSTFYNNRNQVPGYSQSTSPAMAGAPAASSTAYSAPTMSAPVVSAPVAGAAVAATLPASMTSDAPASAAPVIPATTTPIATDTPASPPTDSGDVGS